MSDKPTLPGINYVGAGYDPFGSYAESDSIISTIFDWENADKNTFENLGKSYSKPKAIDALSQSKSYTASTVGEDIQTYQSNLAAGASISGSYLFFSGSLSTEFNQQSLSKSENSFSRTQMVVSVWSLQMTVDSSSRAYLKKEFKKALDNLSTSENSCKEFFEMYGSHILTGIMLGGRALRTASTDKYKVENKYSLEVMARESANFAAGSVESEQDVKYSEAVSSFNANSDVHESVIGGDPVLAETVFRGKKENFLNWANTIAKEPALIEFVQNPLTPIWKLCASDEKGNGIRSALEKYYTDVWAPRRSFELARRPAFIDALNVFTGDKWDTGPPHGYEKLEGDLNKGAEGKYIWICYHKQEYDKNAQSQQAITDLEILYDKSEQPSPGFTKIPNDLNEGANGKYIYLAYKRGPYDSDTAILDLKVINGKSALVPTPYGFTRLDRDLNKGADGDYVYLTYAKRLKSLH